jgi:hypothetical protein
MAPDLPPPVPEGMVRIHVFAGRFDSVESLEAYCFRSSDANHPEPLNNDLPGAFVDTDFVDAGFGPKRRDLIRRLMPEDMAAEVLARGAGTNAFVIVHEDAFNGLPYALGDTPRLAYLGAWEVPAT